MWKYWYYVKVEYDCTNKKIVVQLIIAYEHVLQGALVAVWQKERELATTSLEFDYLHQKSQCKMMIGGMTLVMMSLPSRVLSHVFHFLFTFALILASHWLTEIWQLSFPEELACKLRYDKDIIKCQNHELDCITHNLLACGASSPIWASEVSLARTQERAAKPRGAEERRACNDLSKNFICTLPRRREIPLAEK